MEGSAWSLLVKVPNLLISADIGGEFRIECVTFIAGRKIPRIRKRLGFGQRISKWSRRLGRDPLFEPDASYAHIEASSRAESDLSHEYRRLNEAIYILASSLFDRTTKREGPPFGRLDAKHPQTGEEIMFERGGSKWKTRWSSLGQVSPYVLNKDWQRYLSHHFFPALVHLLNADNSDIEWRWRWNIRRAAILAGQSLFSPRLEDAFLRNMVALEVLLSHRGDRFPDALVDRVHAVFGWLSDKGTDYNGTS